MYEPMILVDVTHRRRNNDSLVDIDIDTDTEQTNRSFNIAHFVKMFNELFRLFLLILREADTSSIFKISRARSQWSP